MAWQFADQEKEKMVALADIWVTPEKADMRKQTNMLTFGYIGGFNSAQSQAMAPIKAYLQEHAPDKVRAIKTVQDFVDHINKEAQGDT